MTVLSSIRSPVLHFLELPFVHPWLWAGYPWVIKSACGCCGRGSVYPVAQLRVGSCVCVLLISRPSKWSALLQPFGAHQRNFTLAHQPFSVPCCQPNPHGHRGIHSLAIFPSSLPILLKNPSLFICLLFKHSITAHMMGLNTTR